jgi:hypothetical protein
VGRRRRGRSGLGADRKGQGEQGGGEAEAAHKAIRYCVGGGCESVLGESDG